LRQIWYVTDVPAGDQVRWTLVAVLSGDDIIAITMVAAAGEDDSYIPFRVYQMQDVLTF
jgi:hypothetical protein